MTNDGNSTAVQKRTTKSSRLDNVHGHIFTPRSYQVELLDVAINRNSIVCLGNGTGKTFIAVMLIKELAYQVRPAYNENGKRTILLVDSDVAVDQHAKVIGMHTDLSVASYGPEIAMWSHDQWRAEITEHNVFVMTPQVFFQIIVEGLLPLSKINLLIFDECHHAVNNHLYVQIMNRFEECPVGSCPRILGLTSSILNGKCHPDVLERSLSDLELTLHSTADTAPDMIVVDLHGTKPKEIVIDCDTYVDSTGLVERLGHELQVALDFLLTFVKSDETGEKDPRSGAKVVISECLHILRELGPWCAARVAQAFYKQLAKVEEYEADEVTRRFIQMAATLMRMVQRVIDDVFDSQVQTLEEFMLFTSPKVVCLLEVLREYKPDDNFTIIGGGDFSDSASEMSDDSFDGSDEERSDVDDPPGNSAWSKRNNIPKSAKSSSHYVVVKRTAPQTEESGDGAVEEEGICGIVFVERKHTAFVLNKLIVELCNWDVDLYFVRSHYITSQGMSSSARDTEAGNQKQEEVLRKFRQREYNLLVSTNILEEGVDVPKCNVIIRFALPDSYRSYVQSKGRARATNSKYYMLVNHEIFDQFAEDLRKFKGIETILLSRCHNQDDHSHENIKESAVVDMLPPYAPLEIEGAPRVTMLSAIRLVNKYCAKLPSDAFTHLTPKCYVETVEKQNGLEMYRARLQLPINSPIKEAIVGDEMPNRRLAQMAVALRACEILHKAGELDDHLQPIGKELIKYEDEESEWEDHELHGLARPGTTKRKQYYCKKIAAAMIGRPKADIPCWMYSFNMFLTCPITEEQNTRGRAIHAPEDTSRGFGIICENEIPTVPCFPIFTRSGEVTTSIDLVSNDVVLCQQELDRLYKFHHFIFAQVLRLEKAPMAFDPDKSASSCIVVPLNIDDSGKIVIDWKFISSIEESSAIPTQRKRATENSPKEKFVFDEKTLADAVVMPSYRNIDQPQYFYVAEIRYDLNLLSPFPSPELYDTFKHYYISKYGLEITNVEQPLLDVDHTSARLNLLTPRYMNQKGVALPTSSAENRRAKRENLQQKQILVPELCIIHPFPASLWRKTVCIPAILYRVNYLLIAEELRVRIAKEAKVGRMPDEKNYWFPPLQFGFVESERYFEIDQFESPKCGVGNHTKNDDSGVGTENCDEGIVGRSFESSETSKSGDVGKNLDEKDNSSEKLDGGNGQDGCEYSLILDSNVLNGNFNEGTNFDANDTGKMVLNGIEPKNLLNGLEIPNQNAVKIIDSLVQDENHISQDEPNEMSHDRDHDMVGSAKESAISQTTNFCSNDIESSVVDVQETSVSVHFAQMCVSENGRDDSSRDVCEEVKSGLDLEAEKQIVSNGQSELHSNSESGEEDAKQRNSDKEEKSPPKKKSLFSLDTEFALGPSPCDLIQTLTMSNANDFFNLERLETIGDSFLKFAITVYLYCTYPGIHEGKLSYLRSIQVSNYNLYRLGKKKGFPECMVAVKFEPMENWLPPGYIIKSDGVHPELNVCVSSRSGPENTEDGKPSSDGMHSDSMEEDALSETILQERQFSKELEECIQQDEEIVSSVPRILIPYNLQTQHSLPDKSIADCVEALIGCYLATCGQRAALLLMAWLGLKVLPVQNSSSSEGVPSDIDKSLEGFGYLQPPVSPLLQHVAHSHSILDYYLNGYNAFEESIQYKFQDRSYLLQAFTHASYHYNTVTDCYQRLEFLGDAILDYVITRHLFEDSIKHSPGILTDLRSALVNNNIFASLAVQWNFHKFFKAISPQLFHVIEKFVMWQKEHESQVLFEELECDNDGDEDIEIPKALGDIFESIAGAIYLDSGMSLDTVWRVYHRMMKPHIDAFMEKIPKSPVRELLEMEPETAKFEKPERTMDGKVRVTVNVVGKGSFKGVGRNYRIAKSAAAKRALKCIKLVC